MHEHLNSFIYRYTTYIYQLICLVLDVALYLNNCEQSNFLLFFSNNPNIWTSIKFYNQWYLFESYRQEQISQGKLIFTAIVSLELYISLILKNAWHATINKGAAWFNLISASARNLKLNEDVIS